MNQKKHLYFSALLPVNKNISQCFKRVVLIAQFLATPKPLTHWQSKRRHTTNDPHPAQPEHPNRGPVPLSNASGTICATNSLLQAMAATSDLHQELLTIADKELPAINKDLGQAVSRIMFNIMRGTQPALAAQAILHNALHSQLAGEQRSDPWGNPASFWRELAHPG